MTERSSSTGRPSISVITVCFNAAATIEATLASVAAQTHPAIEQIIVDGGSTDGTLDVVRRLARSDARIVSEKDDGIFDAMNKGAALASGEVVYFLNADDSFVDERVLEDIAVAFESDRSSALVYGNVLLEGGPPGVVNYPARPFRSRSISEFLHNSFCHQAVFVRRALFDVLGPFDLQYRYSADYEWIIRAFKAHGGVDFRFIDRNVAYYYTGGRSQQNAAVTEREVHRMQGKHFLSIELGWFRFRYVWLRRWRRAFRQAFGALRVARPKQPT